MEKQVKQYKDMTTDEKAQAIYNFMMEQAPIKASDQLSRFETLLMDLSGEYDTDTIFTMNDWLEYAEGTDIVELIKIAQRSKDLDLHDKYIRESLYYYGYKTANSVIELVDEKEAVDWIARALDDNNIAAGQLNKMMEEMEENE